MNYLGEIISLGVAVSWTITALSFEFAGKRIGALSLNIIRLAMAIVMLGLTLWCFTGTVIPLHAGREAWIWLSVSGFIGYVLGDYCLFNAYILIGSRFGQLFMTLAPPSAALAGMLILGEHMSVHAIIGMFVTVFGIGLSIIGRSGNAGKKLKFTLPIRGILLGIGGGVGQGVGLVFSKLGMNYFMEQIDTADKIAVGMVPFASTQIRAFVGIAGFLLVLLFSGKPKQLRIAVKDGRAMWQTTLGTIFGPFLGVSFSLMAVQYTQAGVASTLMAITPVIILAPAYFIFKQTVTVKELIGAIISVCGVALFFI